MRRRQRRRPLAAAGSEQAVGWKRSRGVFSLTCGRCGRLPFPSVRVVLGPWIMFHGFRALGSVLGSYVGCLFCQMRSALRRPGCVWEFANLSSKTKFQG